MHETCKSCGTIFEVDESVLTENIQWFKCGVCNKKWSSSTSLDKNSKSEKNEHKNKSEQVKHELASIKSVVEDKSKILAKKNNPVLDQKNKTVAEIASELSLSELNKSKDTINKKLEKTKDQNNSKKFNLLPFIIIFIVLFLSFAIFFRPFLISYGFLYFPTFTQTHIEKINTFFNKIELPILSQTNYLNLTNFIATVQEQEVRFTGVIKNNSKTPILTPRIKILVIREDRKIILEKILILDEKIIPTTTGITFNKRLIIDIENKKENVTVKATFLKKF